MSRIKAFPGTAGTAEYSGEIDLRGELSRMFHGSSQEIAKSHKVLLRRARRDSNDKLIPCPCVDELTREPDIDVTCPICVVKGAAIPTREGIKEIQEVIPGDSVLTHTGSYNLVTNTSAKLYTDDIVSVDIEGRNNMPLRVTDDHQVLVYKPTLVCHQKRAEGKLCLPHICNSPSNGHCSKKGKDLTVIPTFVPAKDIKCGDYLVFPKKTASIKPHTKNIFVRWDKYRAKHGKVQTELPSVIVVDYDLMFFLGWYVAEGSGDSPGRKTRSVIFSLNAQKEMSIAKRLLSIAKEKFGLEGQVIFSGTSLRVVLNHALLSRWMHYICGRYSDHKCIPSFVWQAPKDLQRAFLSAYAEGDGHVDNNRVTTKTVSKTLAEELYLMGMCIGYYPTITFKPHYTDKMEQSHADSWILRWHKSYEKNEVTQLKKWRRRFISGDYIFARVNAIKTSSEVTSVYDLTVADKHNFVANGCVVHNCGPYGDGYLWDEEWVDCRRVHLRPSSSTMIMREQYQEAGDFNVAAIVYYFEYNVAPRHQDRILEMRLDAAGDLVIPYVRERLYTPDFVDALRSDTGRIEYYAVYCIQKDSISIGE